MEKKQKKVSIAHSLITFGVLILVMAVGIIVYGVDVHVPMFIGVVAAAIMALYLGFKWDFIEKAMMDGIYNALQAVIILMIVGVLVGVWIAGGIVPAGRLFRLEGGGQAQEQTDSTQRRQYSFRSVFHRASSMVLSWLYDITGSRGPVQLFS